MNLAAAGPTRQITEISEVISLDSCWSLRLDSLRPDLEGNVTASLQDAAQLNKYSFHSGTHALQVCAINRSVTICFEEINCSDRVTRQRDRRTSTNSSTSDQSESLSLRKSRQTRQTYTRGGFSESVWIQVQVR